MEVSMIDAPRRDEKDPCKIPPSRFRFRPSHAFLFALALGLTASMRPAYATERVWSKQFDLPPGGHVSIVNVQGSVVVEGWDRAEVEATVAMRSKAPGEHLSDVQVAVESHDHAIEFHTLYPQGNDSPVRVDYRLR